MQYCKIHDADLDHFLLNCENYIDIRNVRNIHENCLLNPILETCKNILLYLEEMILVADRLDSILIHRMQ